MRAAQSNVPSSVYRDARRSKPTKSQPLCHFLTNFSPADGQKAARNPAGSSWGCLRGRRQRLRQTSRSSSCGCCCSCSLISLERSQVCLLWQINFLPCSLRGCKRFALDAYYRRGPALFLRLSGTPAEGGPESRVSMRPPCVAGSLLTSCCTRVPCLRRVNVSGVATDRARTAATLSRPPCAPAAPPKRTRSPIHHSQQSVRQQGQQREGRHYRP